jgi:O-antigen ligase
MLDGPNSSPVRFPSVMSGSPAPSQEGGRIIPVLLLFALGAAVTGATVFAGGPIAQSHGDLRTQILYCLTAIGLPGFAYWAVTKRLCSPGSPVYLLAFLLPAYAFWQTLPLPLAVIRLLSPSRAALTEALRPVIPVPAWVPISVVPSATLFHFLTFAACAVLFLVVFDLSGRFASPWVLIVPLIVAAVGQAVLGLVQISVNPDAVATGTYPIRNHYAGLLAMILPFPLLYPFVVVSAREREKRSPVLGTLLACAGFFIALLLAVALIASLSRAAFLSVIVSLAFVAAIGLCRGRSRRGISIVIPSVVLIATAAVVLLPNTRLVQRLGQVEQDEQDRSLVWHETGGLIKAYPVFGTGLGAYGSAFLKFKRSVPALDQDYAHNDYLQYFAEMGLLGFSLGFAPLVLPLTRLLPCIGKHERFPDRRVHTDSHDEWNSGAAVPRVRRGFERFDREVHGRIADCHADDVRAPAEGGAQSRTTVSPERGLFSVDYRNLWRRASGGARSSGVYDNRHGADDRYQRVFVCQSAKGFLPAAEFSPAFCCAATPFAGATASENLYLRQMKRLPRYAWR